MQNIAVNSLFLEHEKTIHPSINDSVIMELQHAQSH